MYSRDLPYINLNDQRPEVERRMDIEEQRRLFYVALTRTRKTLILSSISEVPLAFAHSERFPIRSSSKYTARLQASKFLDELGVSAPIPISGDELLRQYIEIKVPS